MTDYASILFRLFGGNSQSQPQTQAPPSLFQDTQTKSQSFGPAPGQPGGPVNQQQAMLQQMSQQYAIQQAKKDAEKKSGTRIAGIKV